MKQIVQFILAAFTVAACQDNGPTAVPDIAQLATAPDRPVHQVVGAGSVVREDVEGSPRETYGFHAQNDAFGNVSGEAEVQFPSDDVKMHIDVQCLAVQGNEAWLSGPVTHSNNATRPVGRVYLWRVQDNGHGDGVAPDRISNFVYRAEGNFSPDVCRWKPTSMVTYPWDNGNVRILTLYAMTLGDLVGTWDATKLIYVNQADPADTLDVIAAGAAWRMTVAPSGRYTMLWWLPAVPVMFENTTGIIDVVDGRLQVRADGDPDRASLGYAARSGNVLYLQGEVDHDWDGDGDDDDPSDVFVELRIKRTGVLVGDLAGTWDAISWRYTSVATPAESVELVAGGVSIQVSVGLDSHWRLTFAPGGTREGDLLVEGSLMLTRTGSMERVFTFHLQADAWYFAGLSAYDFDANPATAAEPASLEVTLVRR